MVKSVGIDEKKMVKIAEAVLEVINRQISMQGFGLANGRTVGAELMALPSSIAIEPSLPLDGQTIHAASFEDAKQAVNLLEGSSQDFRDAFTVHYHPHVIRIVKRHEHRMLAQIAMV